MGGLSSRQILSLLQSESLASFRFLRLDNTSCQSNHSLYIVPNFEGLKPYAGAERNGQEKNNYIRIKSGSCVQFLLEFFLIKTC